MPAMREKLRYQERREYIIRAVRPRRKKVRQMAVDYLGDRCQKCGYNRCPKALEFQHKEKSGKDFGISALGYTRSWERIQQELDKCVLLCANCHREEHRFGGLSIDMFQ